MQIGYDIRGLYKKEINENLMYFLAEKFFNYLKKNNLPLEIYLGIDTRNSSSILASSFASKFLEFPKTKINYLGVIPTPILYYLSIKNKKSGVIITASHLPSNYNGIKFILPDGSSWVYKNIPSKLISRKPTIQISYKPIYISSIFENYLKELFKKIKIKDKFIIRILNSEQSTNLFIFKLIPQIFKNIKVSKPKKIIDNSFYIKSDVDGDRLEIYFKKQLIIPEVLLYSILKVSNYKKVGISITIHKKICKLFPQIKFYFIKTGHSNFKDAYKKYKLDFAMEPSYHFYFFKDFQTEAPLFALFKVLKYHEKNKNIDELKEIFPLERIEIKKKLNIDKIQKTLINEGFKMKVFDDFYLYKKNKNYYLAVNFRQSKTEKDVWRIFIEASDMDNLKNLINQVKYLIK